MQATIRSQWHAINKTESAQNWLRVKKCYLLAGHRLSNLSNLNIDFKVNYTLGTFAAMNGL